MSDVHKLVQNTYDKIAEKYHKRYGQYSDFFLKFSKKFIKLLPPKAEILDLGCGPGRDAKYFSQKGLDVTGVDFSKSMIGIARKSAPKAKFIQKDFRKLNFAKNSFDGIWCSFALLHLKKKEVSGLLKQIYGILKNKGILFIATKQGKGEHIEKENLEETLLMYETLFARDELGKMVKVIGFDLVMTDLGYDRYESDEKIIVILAKKI